MNAETRSEESVMARVSRRFAAPAERVFDAWLDPQTARRWLFTTPEGEIVKCEIDARVGGGYVITDRRDGEETEHVGEYLEIDRPRRLVFTLAVPKFSPDADRVTVEIVPLEGGGCEVTISHELSAANAHYLEQTAQGWQGLLEGLASALGEG